MANGTYSYRADCIGDVVALSRHLHGRSPSEARSIYTEHCGPDAEVTVQIECDVISLEQLRESLMVIDSDSRVLNTLQPVPIKENTAIQAPSNQSE